MIPTGIDCILEVDAFRSEYRFPVSSSRRQVDLGIEITSAG